jgi:hypothetical protein
MTNPLNLTDDLAIALNIDNDEVEKYIIKAYTVSRLKPLLGTHGATEQKLNALTNIFYGLYTIKDYTLDILINSVYNYINATNRCPPNNLFTDNIETFLEEYGQE